ncbi:MULTISPECIES: hypothetical protein [Bacillaceae]|nr:MULTISPECIES: hypothetical protein [Bacillaceae]
MIVKRVNPRFEDFLFDWSTQIEDQRTMECNFEMIQIAQQVF